VPLYSIPYRCLYSKNIANLLMAGRDISVSHVALGTTRVMQTCGTEGQAVGTAAALCLQHACSPRELGRQHLAELQNALLRDDAYLLEMPLREPDNLAQAAQVTASSSVASTPFTRDSLAPTVPHKLDFWRAAMLPAPGHKLAGAALLLSNSTDHAIEVTLSLRATVKLGRFEGPELATAKAAVAPGRGWTEFHFDRDLGDAAGIWFVLPSTPGLSWWLAAVGPEGAHRAYAGKPEAWTPAADSYALITDPPPPAAVGGGPEAAIDGWSRPHDGLYGGWISDPRQPLPQWLALSWPQARTVGRVELVFDTNLGNGLPSRLIEKETVKAYRLEAKVGDGWRTLVEVTDNALRLRKHTFEPVTTTALRLVVTETGGDRSARVYEMRAYER
jgi:hypothetical protein